MPTPAAPRARPCTPLRMSLRPRATLRPPSRTYAPGSSKSSARPARRRERVPLLSRPRFGSLKLFLHGRRWYAFSASGPLSFTCLATIDLLGESTESKADATATLKNYEKVVDALDECGLKGGISVKLTGLGLTLNDQLCRANLEEIVEYAKERGRFVRVDMEVLKYTETTVNMVRDVHGRHENIGAVFQAYMRRSIEDVQTAIEAGFSVRLCKGIY